MSIMTKKEFMSIETGKATKTELLDALKSMPKGVNDKNLLERVQYTLTQAGKSIRKVTVADLKELVDEAISLLSAPAQAPVEASFKKGAPKKSSKKVEVEEDADDEDTEEEAPKASKPPKKGLKKTGMKTAKPKTKASNELPVASMFPSEIVFDAEDGEITLMSVHDKYHTIGEVREAIENGETLYIAAYWTKRHIQQYNYKEQFRVPQAPKSFPDDLDILNIVIACDNIERVFAMSTYTEALYQFNGEAFNPVEDKDENGNEFTVRVSNGMEFEVYVPAE